MKKIINFFDKVEDRVRGTLARHPFVYAMVGGVGVVLFWRGIWHTADTIPFLSGPVSIVLGLIILVITGAFVSSFVSNRLILTGIKGEKQLSEKSVEQIKKEEDEIEKSTDHIESTLQKIEDEITEIKKELK
ncbi:MAG: hypothetical protein WA051_00175 [Minisyncoccia bacterium]